MKLILENVLEFTSILIRVILCLICYKVHANLTLLMAVFYFVYVAATMYYTHLKNEEEKEFLEQVRNAIENSVKNDK